MKPIRTERLILRNWEERDRELFHRINSDERVMEFFPFRRDRAAADAKMDELRALDRRGRLRFRRRRDRRDGRMHRLCRPRSIPIIVPSLPAGTIEIGWRLAPEFWGKGYVTEAAEAWLAFGFETLGLDEIVSFAVADNRRSTAVMERLGMTADPASDFDHPAFPTATRSSSGMSSTGLSREDWQARKKAAR